MILFLGVLFSLYFLLIIALAIGFGKVDMFKDTTDTIKTTFSVVIPFRNEANNLPNLLESIKKIAYPTEIVEFLLVNDASDDNSVEIIEAFLDKKQLSTISILNNKRVTSSPKKDAILTAISVAKHNWIVTTDADCILPEKWLATLDSFIQKNAPKMVVSPVNYSINNTFLEQFQLLDFISLQGVTIGGFGMNAPLLCNGANLAYKKEDFIRHNGFEGNNNMASGDDVFLFEKFLADDEKSVQFLKSKDAMVTTFPVVSWGNLIHQRIRWAAKTGNLKSIQVKIVGLLVFLVNFWIVASIFGAVFGVNTYETPLVLWTAKLLIDLLLFIPAIRFYNHTKTFFKSYLFCCLLYPFFSVFVVFKSVFFQYDWKGRSFKK